MSRSTPSSKPRSSSPVSLNGYERGHRSADGLFLYRYWDKWFKFAYKINAMMNVIVIGATSGIGRAVAEIWPRDIRWELPADVLPCWRSLPRRHLQAGPLQRHSTCRPGMPPLSWPLSWRRWAEWISACIRPVSGSGTVSGVGSGGSQCGRICPLRRVAVQLLGRKRT